MSKSFGIKGSAKAKAAAAFRAKEGNRFSPAEHFLGAALMGICSTLVVLVGLWLVFTNRVDFIPVVLSIAAYSIVLTILGKKFQ